MRVTLLSLIAYSAAAQATMLAVRGVASAARGKVTYFANPALR